MTGDVLYRRLTAIYTARGADGLAEALDRLAPADLTYVDEIVEEILRTGGTRARLPWRQIARPEQLPPDDWTRTWFCRGGRGSGKTRTGAETFAEMVLASPPGTWAAVAPTFGDARDVMIEGESGLIAAFGGRADVGGQVRKWNRSIGELYLVNGSVIRCDGANDGALRIQGKNLRGCWADEVGLWTSWRLAWEESIGFAVRKAPAKIVATGTPKPGHGLVKMLLEDPTTPDVRLRTEDNRANLSDVAVQWLLDRHEGTRLGMQELDGEFIEQVEGAAWYDRELLIEANRIGPLSPAAADGRFRRIVVGVDPPGGATECGIVVAGLVKGRCWCGEFTPGRAHLVVLEDASGLFTPDGWARRVLAAYERWGADAIVGERNFGGDMVEDVILTRDSSANVRVVTATRGKIRRAEPVVGFYEQGRAHHAGVFERLETEQSTFVDGESWSPNRMDALVWAVSELSGDASSKPASLSGPAGRAPRGGLASAGRPRRLPGQR